MAKLPRIKVGIGLRTESLVQIVDGLKFGDTLLTSGILQLRQNLPVVLDTLDKKLETNPINKVMSLSSESINRPVLATVFAIVIIAVRSCRFNIPWHS